MFAQIPTRRSIEQVAAGPGVALPSEDPL